MSVHKRVFQKCLTFQKLEKVGKIGTKRRILSIKFEHKKTKSKYNVNFPFNYEC